MIELTLTDRIKHRAFCPQRLVRMSRCFKHVTIPEMNEIVLQKTAFCECAGELSLALDRAQNLPLCVKDRVCSWTVFCLEATLQSPLLLANISLSCPVWNTPVTSKSASYSLLLCLFVLSLLLCWKAGKWNPLHVSFSFFKFTRRKIYSVQYCCCGVFFPICNFCFVFLSIMYVYVFKWRISLKAFSHLAYVLSNTILSHFCL